VMPDARTVTRSMSSPISLRRSFPISETALFKSIILGARTCRVFWPKSETSEPLGVFSGTAGTGMRAWRSPPLVSSDPESAVL